MISPLKKHTELQKLSDKFQQPFEVSQTKQYIATFNGKLQKKGKLQIKKRPTK